MLIQQLRPDVQAYLRAHRLETKWKKACLLFEENIRHPSPHTELLEPKWRGIYSFRLDRKYHVLFFVHHDVAEVISITNHYKK